MQKLYINEIIGYWIAKINADIASGLGLILTQKGTLEFYPESLADLESDIPAIFIDFKDFTSNDIDADTNLDIDYNFQIVFVKKVVLTTAVEQLLNENIRTISEMFWDYINMEDFTGANITIKSAMLTSANKDNMYNTILGGMTGKDLRAVEFNLRVQTLSTRR